MKRFLLIALLPVLVSASVLAQDFCPCETTQSTTMREYPAMVYRVVDGDTLDLEINLGFDVFTIQRIRLAEIDAWEVRGEERPKGLLAKAFVQALIPEGSIVTVRTEGKRGKYGRYIVWIEAYGQDLGEMLIEKGHAELYR